MSYQLPERTKFFLFALKGSQRRRLGWGTSPVEALATLALSHTPAEMKTVITTDVIELHHQREIPALKDMLG